MCHGKFKSVFGGGPTTVLTHSFTLVRVVLFHMNWHICLDYARPTPNKMKTSWMFCSSVGVKQQIDFILRSCDLNLTNVCASDLLDLGSDHRSVHALFTVEVGLASRRHISRRRTCIGWQPASTKDFPAALLAIYWANARLQSMTLNTLSIKCAKEHAKTTADKMTTHLGNNRSYIFFLLQRRAC